MIIIFGAVAGTYFTRRLALLGDIRLVFLFSFFGILITLAVNYLIIKSALNPLRELGQALEQVSVEQVKIPADLKKYEDQDIHRLVTTVDAMLTRLEKRTSLLKAISERAIHAQEEERVRIARSLHDDTAQTISMLIINLERIEKKIPQDDPDLSRRVSESYKVATLLLENLRKVIWDLRPSILDDLGLIPAIRWYAQTNLDEKGIQVEMKVGIGAMRLPPHLETMLFRILQEAVSNIVRHAKASNVIISLRPEGNHVILEVRDNGRGFDVERTTGDAVTRKQLGLLGMQERASLVNGLVKVESTPGVGTTLRVYIPLNVEDAIGSNTTVDMELQKEMR
ncbi:MAG: sensor histidine kinase [Chloroflexi bacterium]|nr:sensor histidine kinase [Chloroflexota bacterium]